MTLSEIIRTRVCEYGLEYEGEEKGQIVRPAVIQLIGQYSDLSGYGVYLPNVSNEIPDTIDSLGVENFILAENNPNYIDFLQVLYAEIGVHFGDVDTILAINTKSLSHGHLDYCGQISATTKPRSTIEHLLRRATPRSCFAFTYNSFDRSSGFERVREYAHQIEKAGLVSNIPSFREEGFASLLLSTWAHYYSPNIRIIPVMDIFYCKGKKSRMNTIVLAFDKTQAFNRKEFELDHKHIIKEIGRMTITEETKSKIYRAIQRGDSDSKMQVWWPTLTVESIRAYRANLTRNPKLAK